MKSVIVKLLIIVNCFTSCFSQRGNPLLKHIRNVKWTFADVVPDYLLGQSSCALYLRSELHSLSIYSTHGIKRIFLKKIKLCSLDLPCRCVQCAYKHVLSDLCAILCFFCFLFFLKYVQYCVRNAIKGN